MKYVGVIVGPGRKSLSPVIQQAALDHLGLEVVYETWETPEDALEMRLLSMRSPAALGANVTIPHKEAIVPLLDEVDGLVRKVGAVNTVVNDEGRLYGYNTDVEGFLRALREDGRFDPAGHRPVVVGAGGSARAVVVALSEAGAAAVTVVNRTRERAQRLVEMLGVAAGDTELRALPASGDEWLEAVARSSLLINCTPAGAAGAPQQGEIPVPAEVIHPGLLVYDLVYLPAETALMFAARRRGARVLGGLPMLVYQGAASFWMWTGQDAPVDVMMAAAKEALGLGAGGDV